MNGLSKHKRGSRALVGAVCVLGLVDVACGGATRRFPLKAPLTRDTDLDPVHVSCRPEEDKKTGVKKAVCTPDDYESPFAWDGANQLVFRPISRFFAVDPAGPALNVNAVDEVADSSWFVNRMGSGAYTPDDVARGYCDKELDPNGAAGSWPIDQGKPNGANPGFRVKVPGYGKFMLKADIAAEPERASGATAIASRIYYALGWWAPCDSVVYFPASVLKLKPGLKVTDNSGVTKDFDAAALKHVLGAAVHKGDLVRMVASKWLPGRTIGPFTYEGKRSDDPNDVIPHEDRRDLRGARVIAAWLNHFDSREQNSMDTWMPVDEKDSDSSPGHVRHWYIDLGDCFGSQWDADGISRRLGFSYYLDFEHVAADFATFGLIERPWERAEKSKSIFGYFHSRDFEPDSYHGGYPNPAFMRLTEHDGAWAARKIARFTDAHLAAAVAVGKYSDTDGVEYLRRHLAIRRDIILRRYFRDLSPVGELAVKGNDLCGVDLARFSKAFDASKFAYSAKLYTGGSFSASGEAAVRAGAEGETCVPLRHHAGDGGARDDDASRYMVVDLTNGQSKGLLRAHLYDLGPKKGFRLVGVERPFGQAPPG